MSRGKVSDNGCLSSCAPDTSRQCQGAFLLLRHLFLIYSHCASRVKQFCLISGLLVLWCLGVARADEPLDKRVRELVVARYGDGVTSIAQRYGMTSEALMRLNPGLKPWGLMEGDAVVVIKDLMSPPILQHDRQIRRGPRGRKQVALTFDGAWTNRKQLESLLAVLKKHEAGASFFVTGIFLDEVPDGVELIHEAGFPIYNHTARHYHLTKEGNAIVKSELLKVESRVADSSSSETLSTLPYWRPPYGESDGRVRRSAADVGFQAVYWTVDSLDWMTEPPATVESIFQRVCVKPLSDIPEHDPDPLDGAIVLFHIDGKATPAALERVIPFLKERGYDLVSLSEMLRADEPSN